MFTVGFQKTASEERKENRNSAVAGGAVGAAAYTAARHGKKTDLMRTTSHAAPKSALGRMADRVLYGADHMGYDVTDKRPPKKAQKYHGTVLHEQAGSKKHFSGKKNIGDFTHAEQHALDDKHTEHKLLSKYEKGHPKASLLDNFKGKNKAKKMYGKFKNGFIVKPTRGEASGVGGAKFMNDDDYAKKHFGIKNKKQRTSVLSKSHKAGKRHLVQEKMNIKKDLLTGASREVRVHAIGGKVVPGASSIRSSNVSDVLHLRSAEKHMQRVLDKMPAKHKRSNMTWAADVANTDKGMKIIETNRGANSSGLLDPKFLHKTHGGVKGTVAAAGAVSKNNKIYKHITGRHTPIAAAGRALLAGGAVAAASKYFQKHKREQNSQ